MTRLLTTGQQTKSELRRSEERFRVLSSIVSEGVMIHRDRVVLDANQAFVDIVGLASPEEVIGRDGMDVIRFTPESRQKVQEHLQSGTSEVYDIEIVRPDGSILPAETHGRTIEYQGQPARLVSMRDISERKRADAALRESEQNYREIFNATSDALFIHDENGRILDVNERMCAMFGCDRKEALEKSANDFSLGESPYSEKEAVEKLRTSAEQGSHTFVWRSRRSNGELFWSEVALRACEIAGKKRVIASVRDVSERKATEDALADEKRLAEAHFESLPGAAYVYGEDLRLVRWNSNYAAVFSREGEGFVPEGLHALDTIAQRDRERIAGVVDEIFAHGNGDAEFHIQAGDGQEIPYYASARVVELSGERFLVGVGFDISERAQSEAEKDHLQEQLQQATKMEAVGQLAGGVAHDFNNLLMVIAGNIELAQDVAAPDNPLLTHLVPVQKAAASAADLTRQLLAFSRRQIIEPRHLSLNSLVVDVRKLLNRLITENIEIRTALDPNLGAVNVDPAQFEQLVVNLAVNARDAMPDGGEIVIETRNLDLGDDRRTRSLGLRPGPYVGLSVADTGHGMNDEVKRHVFEPFFTTKAKGRGTGLGLATIFGTVRQAGGAIEVQSAVDHGTTFRIYLPRLAEDILPADGDGVVTDTPGGGETVLLVEDDTSVRRLAQAFLKRLGYTVLPAASGTEAVALAEQSTDHIDLLLTDVVMPGLSGRQTTSRLFALRPEMKVLYMSGYADDMVVRQGVIEDNLNFIAKPFDLKTLADKLREVLESD